MAILYGVEHTYLEHEGITKFDCQFKLFDEVWVIEGGYSEVVSLLFLSDPVECLLLWVNTQRVAGGLWTGKGEGRERKEDDELDTNKQTTIHCMYIYTHIQFLSVFQYLCSENAILYGELIRW